MCVHMSACVCHGGDNPLSPSFSGSPHGGCPWGEHLGVSAGGGINLHPAAPHLCRAYLGSDSSGVIPKAKCCSVDNPSAALLNVARLKEKGGD